MAVIFGIFIFVLGIVALYVPVAILRGWVLAKLWGWFVVPLGVVPITIPWGIGIALVMGMFQSRSYPKEEKEWAGLGFAIISPLFALLVGWIVQGYMP